MGWDEEGNSFTWRGGTPPTPPIPPVLLMSAACCPCLQAGGNRTVFGASFLHGWGDTARSIPLTEVAPLCFWRGVLIPVRDLGGGGVQRGWWGHPSLSHHPQHRPERRDARRKEGRGWDGGEEEAGVGMPPGAGGGGVGRRGWIEKKRKKERESAREGKVGAGGAAWGRALSAASSWSRSLPLRCPPSPPLLSRPPPCEPAALGSGTERGPARWWRRAEGSGGSAGRHGAPPQPPTPCRW